MTDSADEKPRCDWKNTDPLMIAYHDQEWGVPCHDDCTLFEQLILQGFQAGLSWATILRKRENFRRAFAGWDIPRIAAYGPDDLARLVDDAGIIRNRRKIAGAIKNARCCLEVQREYGSFDRYLWSFVGGEPQRHAPASWAQTPTRTPESDALAQSLRQRGFVFVGTTVCYSLMQSVGMVNDHIQGCFRAALAEAC